jgi:neutral amino acid transport system permease protein
MGYLVYLSITVAIFALFGLGLNLQWGFTGLINFGHVAFMTVGAYVTVLLSTEQGLFGIKNIPLLIAMPIGATVAALLGLLIGISTLRLREDYLAIVTIGVSEVVRLVALNEEWLTRGPLGIQRIPAPLAYLTKPDIVTRGVMMGILGAIALYAYTQLWQWLKPRLKQGWRDGNLWLGVGMGLLGLWVLVAGLGSLSNYALNPKRNVLMLISFGLLALVYWGLERLVQSPWGRVLKAIREDEEVPRALGKPVFWYKLQALMLGGAITGVAGVLYTLQLENIYPDNFQPLLTFYAWIIVVVGGAGNNAGTLVGAVIFWAYNSLTRDLPKLLALLHSILPFIPGNIDAARLDSFRLMLIGLILMVIMMARPQGILGNKDELSLGQ